MKKIRKIIVLILCLLVLGACSKEDKKLEDNDNSLKTDSNNEIEVIEKEEYIDTNPITLGIYKYHNSYTPRELLKTDIDSFTKFTDIGSYEVMFTNEESISSSNFKTVFTSYYDKYENISDYKIGYHINFKLTSGEEIDKNILSQTDIHSFFNYIQVYLYDDVNQSDGSTYSHLEQEDITDETIISSIKLTASVYIDEVISPVTLTAFTYKDENDFDKDTGMYRGNSSYTIKIERS